MCLHTTEDRSHHQQSVRETFLNEMLACVQQSAIWGGSTSIRVSLSSIACMLIRQNPQMNAINSAYNQCTEEEKIARREANNMTVVKYALGEIRA